MPARYYRELLGFLHRTLNDRDAAADLAQESYARILAVRYKNARGSPTVSPDCCTARMR
ncbi:MAG: hypothetical protein EOP39_32780, partial [Rubrivivax sp.]